MSHRKVYSHREIYPTTPIDTVAEPGAEDFASVSAVLNVFHGMAQQRLAQGFGVEYDLPRLYPVGGEVAAQGIAVFYNYGSPYGLLTPFGHFELPRHQLPVQIDEPNSASPLSLEHNGTRLQTELVERDGMGRDGNLWGPYRRVSEITQHGHGTIAVPECVLVDVDGAEMRDLIRLRYHRWVELGGEPWDGTSPL